MEEDIKKLEEFAHDLMQDYIYSQDEIPQCDRRLKQAIDNIIARYKELEKIVKTYNAIPNDYMPGDVKIVIADREYFNNGILKENLIPKSKVKEKIEELKNRPIKMVIDKGIPEKYKNIFLDENAIKVLQELLEES